MSKLKTITQAWQQQGLQGLYRVIYYKATGKQLPPEVTSSLASYKTYHKLLHGKKGLEIGGPSDIFEKGGLIPVYPIVAGLDGCNFSAQTVWEGSLQEGHTYQYHYKRRTGYQYIQEAAELSAVPDGKYDFVLSSHSLEHIANPLKAVGNWLRVLKKNAVLVVVVPHREQTFDHHRPVTPFAHLLEDLQRDTREDDLTHLQEVLDLHDLARDPLAGDFPAFRQRSLRNYENRCLHHHVFDLELVVRIFDHFGLQVEAADLINAFHIAVVGRKVRKADNTRFVNYVKQSSATAAYHS